MKKSQLIAMGLTEEQTTALLDMHKEVLDGKYVAKHRFDEVNNEMKVSKEQLAERDKQIKDLKKFEGDNQELQEKIAELEKMNSSKETDFKKKLALERKKNMVRLSLLEDEQGKPYDVDLVMNLFDLDSIKIDEEADKIVSGFEEQNAAIRGERGFLFSSGSDTGSSEPSGWKPAGSPPVDGDKGSDPVDASIKYGKGLAQVKLGMMGIKPTNQNE